MKLIKIRQRNYRTEITVEYGIWLFKKKITYRTAGQGISGFYRWLKLPNLKRVDIGLEAQLNVWRGLDIGKRKQ